MMNRRHSRTNINTNGISYMYPGGRGGQSFISIPPPLDTLRLDRVAWRYRFENIERADYHQCVSVLWHVLYIIFIIIIITGMVWDGTVIRTSRHFWQHTRRDIVTIRICSVCISVLRACINVYHSYFLKLCIIHLHKITQWPPPSVCVYVESFRERESG